MLKTLQPLALSLALISPSAASLQMLMGGDSGPAEGEMDFPQFFQKAPEKSKEKFSTTFISQDDGKMAIKFSFVIYTNPQMTKTLKSRVTKGDVDLKPNSFSDNQWLSLNAQKRYQNYFPDSDITVSASDLFQKFLEQIIEKTLKETGMPSTQERITSSFVDGMLKAANYPHHFFDGEKGEEKTGTKDLKRPRSVYEKEDAKPSNLSQETEILSHAPPPSKRPRFTKELVAEAKFKAASLETKIQEDLFNFLTRKNGSEIQNHSFSQFFLSGKTKESRGGYVHLSLRTFETPEEFLSDPMFMQHAQRIPLNGFNILSEFETWFEKKANKLFYDLVYNKNSSRMHG